MEVHLIAPHGGRLANRFAPPERAAELKVASGDWFSWDLTPRQLCDLERKGYVGANGGHLS